MLQEAYQHRQEESRTQGSQLSENEIFFEAAGGRNKKGRVRGLGVGADLYYGTSRGRGSGSSSQYVPSVITQMQENFHKELNERVEAIESQIDSRVAEQLDARVEARVAERMAEIERKNKEFLEELASRFTGLTTPFTCSTIQPQIRDPRNDPGGGGGGGAGQGQPACV